MKPLIELGSNERAGCSSAKADSASSNSNSSSSSSSSRKRALGCCMFFVCLCSFIFPLLFVYAAGDPAEHLHPAWAACAALAEPGAPAAVSIEAYAAAALQQKQRHKQQQKKEENQQQKQQQQVELCLGAAWVAACVRDVVGPLFDLGFEAQLHFFELCDPEGELPLEEPIRCTRLLAEAGLDSPGSPHYDFCRSWMEANALRPKENFSTVALFGAACVLVALLLLEAVARLSCWRSRLRREAKAERLAS